MNGPELQVEVRGIVFVDLFGTIAHTGSLTEGYMDALAKYDVPRDKIYAFVRDTLMILPHLTYGEMVYRILKNFDITIPLDLIAPIAKLWEDENKLIAWHPGARELLSSLREQGYIVVIVTNVTAPGLATIKGLLGLERYSDRVIASCELGLVKRSGDLRLWERLRSMYTEVPVSHLTMIGDRDDDQPPDGWNFIKVSSDGSDLTAILEGFKT